MNACCRQNKKLLPKNVRHNKSISAITSALCRFGGGIFRHKQSRDRCLYPWVTLLCRCIEARRTARILGHVETQETQCGQAWGERASGHALERKVRGL